MPQAIPLAGRRDYPEGGVALADTVQEGPTRYLTNEDVYNQLRNEILTLRIHPGEALSENYVADRFNISRTPVRSIILRLSRDGLLDMRGRKGTFVSLIDLDLAEQSLFMRIQVELAAMSYISRHPNKILFRQLAANLEEQQRLVDANADNKAFYSVDSDFHGRCMACIHKQSLWKMIQGMDVHYSRYRYLDYVATREEGVFQTLRNEHAALYECMERGRTQDIRHTLTAHLYGGFLRIDRRLETEYQAFFTKSARSLEEILLDVKIALNETL